MTDELTPRARVNPTTQATLRSPELDALRGFAVLGIFQINIIYFGATYAATRYPPLFEGPRELNILSWGFSHLLVEGAMFALFSMLFGAGALLALDEGRRAEEEGVSAIEHYYRRNLWLILFGVLHAFVLLWPMEILFTYGVLGLALFPLRNLRPRTLMIVGTLMVMWGAQPPSLLYLDEVPTEVAELGSIVPTGIGDWNQPTLLEEEVDEMMAELVLYRSDYLSIFINGFDAATAQQSVNLYQDNIWDAGGMMLIGMALLKWGVLNAERSLLFYLALAVAGFAAAIALRLPALSGAVAGGFASESVDAIYGTQNLIGRLPLALGYVGLIMLLCRWRRLGGMIRALAATGRMAFSHYVGQTLFAIFLFYGFGFALFGASNYYQLLLIALAFGVAQMALSPLWLKHFYQGPLEWLWRTLVRLRWQPFRRSSAGIAGGCGESGSM